jgi:hypothetical protein
MFSDAVEDELAGENPFARLGLASAIECIRRACTGATVTPLKGTETPAARQVRGTLRGRP